MGNLKRHELFGFKMQVKISFPLFLDPIQKMRYGKYVQD
jgi:hypothetical protein